jgi:fatty acid synthase subunit beta
MAMSPLELAYGTVSHTLPIPARLYKSACALRDQYIFSFDQPIDEEGGVIEDVKVPETTKDLVLGFLLFLANNHDDLDLSLSILVAFERVLLGDRDIHSVVARTKRKPAAKAEILRIFFQLKEMAEYPDRQQESNHQGHRIPALLRAAQQAKARVVPIFGGQGNTENPIDELRSVYTIYRPLVESLFVSINKLLVNLSQDVRTGETYLETGFDMLSWLENPHLQPKKEDELSAALSFPLIGLLGLAYYTIFCKVSQITPGEAREYFQGTTGHSQGIIVAAAIAMATSWESFEKVSEEAVTLLFWIGFRSQEAWYPAAPLPALVQESLDLGEGQVSPMLRVRGLKRFEINAHLDVVNSHLPADEAIHVSLVNGKTNIVLTGPPNSLCLLCRQLRKVKKHKSLNLRFVSVNVPFHSSYLLDARERILDDVRELNFRKRDLGIAVYDTRSGYDLRSGTSQTLTEELVAMVTTACVDWPRATQLQGTTHVIDFGPGEINGIGAIIRENYAGSGIRVILASVLLGSETDVGFQPELFSPRTEEIKYEEDWATKYAPTLTSTPSGLLVENKFTRFFGMAPFMVAGMTPTTAHWDFVASCMNAGYHVELAGGGYHNAAAMETAIKKITRHVAPGLGITCNLIYASPQAMQWQLPLIRRLNHEGENIFGLTIGAGVPSLDVASDYIRSYGLRHISFKPASAEAMQQVIVIAKAHPQFPVILQWTGGRGGGHHSSEDFHEPLIEM